MKRIKRENEKDGNNKKRKVENEERAKKGTMKTNQDEMREDIRKQRKIKKRE